MRTWTALYKKELSGFLYGGSACFIFAAYLALSLLAALFLGYYFVVGNPDMRSYFAFQPQVMVMVLPAVTMRLWAEENKNGTTELLFTFPLSGFALVTAKFLAGWTMALLMLALSLPLAFSTALTIETDALNIVSAYLGAVLSAAVLSALGCAVSAMVSLPTAAYLLSVLVGWALVGFNFSPLLARLAEKIPDAPFYLPETLNFSSRYQSFLNGQFSPDAPFYFVSLAAALVFFNWIVIIEKRSGK